MAKMRRRVRTLCNQLGVPLPEEVFALFEGDAEETAEIVRRALSDILDEIKLKSSTGTLEGYSAVKIPLTEKQEIILPQTSFSVVGNFEWFIYVEASGDHQKLDLNVFDALDQGRPQLKRRTVAEGPYPLWNSGFGVENLSNRRVIGTKKKLTIAEGSGDGPRRTNETWRGKGNVPKGTRMPVSYGPLARIEPLNLYDAALRRAKDRLSVKGLSRRWDVIKVGFK